MQNVNILDPEGSHDVALLDIPTESMSPLLGHTRYYRKFIKGYAAIIAPMEKLIKKDVAYKWTQECQGSFDTLNANMASAPILVFPDWDKEFHVHVNASSIPLGVVLAQPGEGDLYHPIAHDSRKLSFDERNYTTMER